MKKYLYENFFPRYLQIVIVFNKLMQITSLRKKLKIKIIISVWIL